ncbi:restriction endonuclease subunit S [Ectopseudomonas mendocina]
MIASREKLGDLCSLVTKGTTPTSVGFDFAERGVPFLRIQNISGNTVSLNEVLYIDEGTHNALARSKIRAGDFLITIAGTIGRTAIVPQDFPESNCNQAVAILRFDESKLWPKFLLYWLSTEGATSQISGRKVTATISNLSLGQIKELEIPLPPLPEQKRIAAILDKADTIRRKRQQAIQLADDFLRAVFLDMFGDPVTNPKGWNVVELSTLVDPDDKLNYGVVQPGDHEEDGVPLVRSGDLSDVTPDVSQLRRVSSSIDSKHRKSKLKGNEILIACVGTIGRVGWVSEAMIGWNIARAVTRIPIREGVNREYVYRYLQNPVVQGYFERETRAVAQPTLNVGLIAKTPVALPPHDLQLAFLERYRTIQAYKERLLVALGAQDELAGCLSQRAFAGQL